MENLDVYQRSFIPTKQKVQELVSKIEPRKHFDKKLVQLNVGKLSQNHKYVGLKQPFEEKMK